jgi:putative endonuclease
LIYYVYLLASRRHGTLYLGVTNNIVRRVYEHKHKIVPGFSAKYDVDRLVWYEAYGDVTGAIRREKQIKKWKRDWKIALIEADNPDWSDLYDRIAV